MTAHLTEDRTVTYRTDVDVVETPVEPAIHETRVTRYAPSPLATVERASTPNSQLPTPKQSIGPLPGYLGGWELEFLGVDPRP